MSDDEDDVTEEMIEVDDPVEGISGDEDEEEAEEDQPGSDDDDAVVAVDATADEDDGDGDGDGPPPETGSNTPAPTTLHTFAIPGPKPAAPNPVLRMANQKQYAIIVPPDERMTDSRLQPMEVAGLLSQRVSQIEQSGRHFDTTAGTKNDKKNAPPSSSELIAYNELYRCRTCPMILRRLVGHKGNAPIYEEWDVNTMTLPSLQPPV